MSYNQSKTDHATNIRLAESEHAAVDMCHCGELKLHLGGLSLRLPPDLAQSLARTLTLALARRQSILSEGDQAGLPGTAWGRTETPRGKA